MPSDLKITPRNLGSLSLAGYCPRCLAYLLRLKFHAPFNHFGAAIFWDMQSSQEAVIGHYLAKDGCLPEEFNPFCDCSARAEFPRHWSKFSYIHESGVILYGAPDEIFVRKDGTLCVVDLKTAHYKGDKDPFHGQYEIQVVGYANIAEGLGLGKVTQGGLLYWECESTDVKENPSDHYSSGKMWVSFVPKPLEIKIDYKILDPLLVELKKVWNSSTLPDGREGCDDCKKLDLLLVIDHDLKIQDQMRLKMYPDVPSVRKEIIDRRFDRDHRLYKIREEFSNKDGEIFANDGVVANWEFLPL